MDDIPIFRICGKILRHLEGIVPFVPLGNPCLCISNLSLFDNLAVSSVCVCFVFIPASGSEFLLIMFTLTQLLRDLIMVKYIYIYFIRFGHWKGHLKDIHTRLGMSANDFFFFRSEFCIISASSIFFVRLCGAPFLCTVTSKMTTVEVYSSQDSDSLEDRQKEFRRVGTRYSSKSPRWSPEFPRKLIPVRQISNTVP